MVSVLPLENGARTTSLVNSQTGMRNVDVHDRQAVISCQKKWHWHWHWHWRWRWQFRIQCAPVCTYSGVDALVVHRVDMSVEEFANIGHCFGLPWVHNAVNQPEVWHTQVGDCQRPEDGHGNVFRHSRLERQNPVGPHVTQQNLDASPTNGGKSGHVKIVEHLRIRDKREHEQVQKSKINVNSGACITTATT